VSLTVQPRSETSFEVDEFVMAFTSFETRVAAAVIAQAVKDYRKPRPLHKTNLSKWGSARTDAERFLFGPGLLLWCSVLDLEPTWVLERLRRLAMPNAACPSVNTDLCATLSIGGNRSGIS
jgi:hypothetical protein